MNQEKTATFRNPPVILFAAAVAGAVIGLFEIANTSIGWHLASGDWILAHHAFLRADPFSFTSNGAPWIDHEWLFQVVVSVAYRFGGPAALVGMRALTIAALAVLLTAISVRSGLSPSASLVLALLCIAGARGRFFVRPELVTLLVVPAAVWLFLRREEPLLAVRVGALAGLMVIGANSHAAVLVVPVLLTGLLGAQVLEMVLTRSWRRGTVVSGLVALSVVAAGLLVNPYGWQLFMVPIRLAHLVGQDFIPNPEWLSPTPLQAPALYAAIATAGVVMALRERRLVYWALLLMVSVLAIRHIRNLGLFFVLLPLAVSPALATWPGLTTLTGRGRRRAEMLAVAAVTVLALSLAIAPWPRFGWGFAEDYYPGRACDFLDAEGLPRQQLYNDVRFGGYLIDRYGPERQVFQDDRNEIHQALLQRIWEIFRSSDVAGWSGLLQSYDIDSALVRYHPPIRVTDPAGTDLGLRGFSTLWFPAPRWALVYWDDVTMVFVRREDATLSLLERTEYLSFRPDDVVYLEARLAADRVLRRAVAAEAARALRISPGSGRARDILALTRP